MEWSGDSLRRFNNARIIAIEKKDGELDDYVFSRYVINYMWNGMQKFVELRSQYINGYDEFVHDSEKSSIETFMKNMLELIEKAIVDGKPVNLVIEAVHKGAIVHFLRKIEFA
jgi:hypothetical protein